MLQKAMSFGVLIFLFLVPTPSLSKCHSGHEPFTDECKRYCHSKRQIGSYGEFRAHCGAPEGLAIVSEQWCLFDCATAKCPCQSCPNGQYVNCPAIPKPRPAPKPPSSSESEGSSGSSVILIVVGIVAVLVIAGCVGGIWFCSTRRRLAQQQQFQYGAPSTTYPNQYPSSYSGQVMPMYQPTSTAPQSPQVASTAPAPAQEGQGFDYRVDGTKA